jgi:CHAT domain-containing protein/tetratricopeptide (TPR) repeat protein
MSVSLRLGGLLAVLLATATALPQPPVPGLRDNFATDSSKNYQVQGEVTWQKGRLTLAAGASLKRLLKVGETVEVRALLQLPPGPDEAQLTLALSDGPLPARLELVRLNGKVQLRQRVEGPFQVLDLAAAGPWQVRWQIRWGLAHVKAWESGQREPDAWQALRALKTTHWQPTALTLTAGAGGGEVQTLIVQGSTPLQGTAVQRKQLKRAVALQDEAERLQRDGRTAQAIAKAQQALGLFRKALPPNHPGLANSLSSLGVLSKSQGQLTAARRYDEQALAVLQKALPPDHPALAHSRNNLGTLLQAEGQLTAARPYYEQALASLQKVLPPDHLELANTLSNVGSLLQGQGQPAAARPYYEQALAIKKKALPADDPDVALALSNLGSLMAALRQFREAQRYDEQALAIRRKKLPPDHPDLAHSLNNLGHVLLEQGQVSAARSYYAEALEIRKKALPADHPDLAVSLHNLGRLVQGLGQLTEARTYFDQALAIKQKALAPDHPHLAQCLNSLGVLLLAQGQTEQGWQRLRQAAAATSHYAARFAAASADADHLAFFSQQRSNLDMLLSAAAQVSALTPAQRDDLLDALLDDRAKGAAALRERHLSHLASRDADTRQLAETVADRRRHLAQLYLAGPGRTPPAQHRQECLRLQRELEDGERALARKLDLGAGALAPEAASAGALRQALPADAALVLLVRYAFYDFRPAALRPPWRAARYAACVVPPAGRGDVALVDLGPAVPLEAAVARLRKQLASAPADLRRDGEKQAEKSLRQELAGVAALVLRPLLPHLKDRPRWLLCPDGPLWLVPWAALPLPDGQYAVERYTVAHVVSGRDLLQPLAAVKPSAPVIVADPDFDSRLSGGRQPPEPRPQGADAPRSARLRFSRLPGTAVEAEKVRPALQSYAGVEPRVLLGAAAREEAVKKLIGPRVLLLSTHGYFLNDLPRPAPDTRGLEVVTTAAVGPSFVPHPLLRCGLALAGANGKADKADPKGTTDDGILTGLEVLDLDLRGTELVVLSACETALGTVNVGEGVAGLRQAFQTAGARGVLATLWQVPDRETVALMTAFFGRLAKEPDQAAALAAAQREAIRERRQRHGAAHPFFWSAFTLTASGR